VANRSAMTKHVLETLAEGSGGALAGYLDTKYADRKLGGLSYGTVFAFAGVACGLLGSSMPGGADLGNYLREAGGGAGAFELGKIVAERTAKSMAQSGQSQALRGRVAGVGALPMGRGPVTSKGLEASLAALRQRG